MNFKFVCGRCKNTQHLGYSGKYLTALIQALKSEKCHKCKRKFSTSADTTISRVK